MDIDNLVLPAVVSLVTIAVTKGIDFLMSNRRERFESLMGSITAVDEITTSATETIRALRERVMQLEEESEVKDRIIINLSRRLAEYTNGKKVETKE